ncbi:MAG: fah [Pseudonocardiales bacterium]|nr:fah [Pseudonocardiales bacterium]
MTTWLDIADDDPFGVDHLPIGVVTHGDRGRFAAVRIGGYALDLSGAGDYARLFSGETLDPFLAAGPLAWRGVRSLVTAWLTDEAHRGEVEPRLVRLDETTAVLGFSVADYVDFYASEHHATNVGRIFRPDGNPLTPNWKHLPVGYHGRAGTVVVSGTEVRRPHGQARDPDGAIRFGPSERLDLEAELAFVVGTGSAPGQAVPVGAFTDHVYGVCLLNDWSARDIQAWEYVPLGPFLGKSFATSIAGWITPLDALSRAWVAPPPRNPEPLPYLDDTATPAALDIQVEVRLNGTVISRPPFTAMYWTPAQLLAHMTVNGAHLRAGDVFASGTVSGSQPDQRGCLLELTWNGTAPITLLDGTTRAFLHDGDEVVITAAAPGPHGPIGLAEVRGRIVPAASATPG